MVLYFYLLYSVGNVILLSEIIIFFLAWPSRYLWRKAVTIINLFCNYPMMSIPILDFLDLFCNDLPVMLLLFFFFFFASLCILVATLSLLFIYIPISLYKPLKMVLSGLYVPCRFTRNCIVNSF